jgi:hypothetical protein
VWRCVLVLRRFFFGIVRQSKPRRALSGRGRSGVTGGDRRPGQNLQRQVFRFSGRPFTLVTASGVPRGAGVLGALGLLPFVGLAATAAVADASLRATAITAIVAYGAVILSFLGGIQWGLTVHQGAAHKPDAGLLWISVTPSLAGWLALLQPSRTVGAALLAVCFAAVLVIDVWLSRRGCAPAWYPRLRMPLTIVVATCLVVAALAAGL